MTAPATSAFCHLTEYGSTLFNQLLDRPAVVLIGVALVVVALAFVVLRSSQGVLRQALRSTWRARRQLVPAVVIAVVGVLAAYGAQRRQRRNAAPSAHASRSPALTHAQIASLGVLLVAAQLPQAVHLPIWVALFGFALVVLRFVLLRRDRTRPLATPARIPSWTLAVFALIIAYPLAYAIAFKSGRYRALMLVLVIAPFFTSFLVRTLAWKSILSDNGFIVETLKTLSLLPEDGRLLATPVAVVTGPPGASEPDTVAGWAETHDMEGIAPAAVLAAWARLAV